MPAVALAGGPLWRGLHSMTSGLPLLLTPKHRHKTPGQLKSKLHFQTPPVAPVSCLYPVDVGLHLQLFYQLPGLCDAGCVIARHGRRRSGLT